MSSQWEGDHLFSRVAEVLWPEDDRLARSYTPRKGKTEARRIMEARYEGFQALRAMVSMRDTVRALCDQVAKALSR